MDRLEQDLAGQAQVLRLSVMDDVGSELALRYRVRSVPTVMLLDGQGEVVLTQYGVPDREDIVSAVAELGAELVEE